MTVASRSRSIQEDSFEFSTGGCERSSSAIGTTVTGTVAGGLRHRSSFLVDD